MEAKDVLTVSAAVVALVSLVKWSGYLPDRAGPLAVLVCSVLGVTVWGFTEGQFERARGFQYFAGWITVMTSAAGIFGFTRATGEALTNMRGTGDGSIDPSRFTKKD